jgi:hypothetical protein
MNIYCVCVDAAGAHEAECVYSVWTDESAANEEAKRLNALSEQEDAAFSLGCYGGKAYVTQVKANEPRNEWIA